MTKRKRLNKKDYARLQELNAHICDSLSEPMRHSITIYRGDMRAIQWAAWWIREMDRELGK